MLEDFGLGPQNTAQGCLDHESLGWRLYACFNHWPMTEGKDSRSALKWVSTLQFALLPQFPCTSNMHMAQASAKNKG